MDSGSSDYLSVILYTLYPKRRKQLLDFSEKGNSLLEAVIFTVS